MFPGSVGATAPTGDGVARGCLLTTLVVLLLGAGVAAAAWHWVVRPYLQDAARDGLREGIAGRVAAVDALPVRPPGELVLTEEELNAHLRADPDAYAPVVDPRVEISADGLRLAFSLFGTENGFSGRPAVRDGRLVLLDGDLEGAAGRLLSARDAAALVEEQLAALLARAGLRPTEVRLGEGAITIVTADASSSTPWFLPAAS